MASLLMISRVKAHPLPHPDNQYVGRIFYSPKVKWRVNSRLDVLDASAAGSIVQGRGKMRYIAGQQQREELFS
jgi:hypothetical protein